MKKATKKRTRIGTLVLITEDDGEQALARVIKRNRLSFRVELLENLGDRTVGHHYLIDYCHECAQVITRPTAAQKKTVEIQKRLQEVQDALDLYTSNPGEPEVWNELRDRLVEVGKLSGLKLRVK